MRFRQILPAAPACTKLLVDFASQRLPVGSRASLGKSGCKKNMLTRRVCKRCLHICLAFLLSQSCPLCPAGPVCLQGFLGLRAKGESLNHARSSFEHPRHENACPAIFPPVLPDSYGEMQEELTESLRKATAETRASKVPSPRRSRTRRQPATWARLPTPRTRAADNSGGRGCSDLSACEGLWPSSQRGFEPP